MKVELLYFEGCPSYQALLPRLRELLERAGLKEEVEIRRVETPEAAEAERFLGSPTVRVNDVDVDPSAPDRSEYGMECRLYRDAAGASPVPPDDWILEALARASE